MPEFEASSRVVNRLTTHFHNGGCYDRSRGVWVSESPDTRAWVEKMTTADVVAAIRRGLEKAVSRMMRDAVYQHRERAEQARVLAFYDRFM